MVREKLIQVRKGSWHDSSSADSSDSNDEDFIVQEHPRATLTIERGSRAKVQRTSTNCGAVITGGPLLPRRKLPSPRGKGKEKVDIPSSGSESDDGDPNREAPEVSRVLNGVIQYCVRPIIRCLPPSGPMKAPIDYSVGHHVYTKLREKRLYRYNKNLITLKDVRFWIGRRMD